MITKLYRLIPQKFKGFLADFKGSYFGGYTNKSYSQEGEDIILNRIFENQNRGFYVDVGANPPKRFSHTYLIYKKGWTG
ncbi:MAG: SAM-dependent methyltransferase, partial [Candidatus Cloacimonetes bacterium]|nr:SAM-dependent methyltransferase [Candidatus Cloacimonadota bacterium]